MTDDLESIADGEHKDVVSNSIVSPFRLSLPLWARSTRFNVSSSSVHLQVLFLSFFVPYPRSLSIAAPMANGMLFFLESSMVYGRTTAFLAKVGGEKGARHGYWRVNRMRFGCDRGVCMYDF